jgi:uncharacterized beta-barrel protein YwiB (DUF1934 family)
VKDNKNVNVCLTAHHHETVSGSCDTISEKAAGEYRFVNGSHVVSYDYQGTRCLYKFDGSQVSVVRRDKYSTKIDYKKEGKAVCEGSILTPAGRLTLYFLTRDIVITEEEEYVKLELVYDIYGSEAPADDGYKGEDKAKVSEVQLILEIS